MASFVKTRDRAAFTKLFERHERAMLAHVRRFVKDRALAEELVQEVFMRVYTAKRYSPDFRFQTWLYRVATNVCLNELRRARHGSRHETMEPEDDDRAPIQLESAVPTPEMALDGARLQAKIEAVLEGLPPKQRAAFLMVRHDGLSHEEIAESLETSVSAVKSLVHRALETLRREVSLALDTPAMPRGAAS